MSVKQWQLTCGLIGATISNDIRRHDYTLTITKPDGTTDSKHWGVINDPTSVQYYQYVPDQVGNYTLKFDYPAQTYTWTSSTPGANTAYTNDFTTDWNYFSLDCDAVANGKLYYFGYSGILYCYDDKTGDLLWTYGNGGAGNSTVSEFETAYGHYPILVSAIADGKVYLLTTEHSPSSPLFKSAVTRY